MSKKLIYLTSFVLVLSVAGMKWSYAWRPNSAEGTINNDIWVNLNWVPGPNMVSHDIYLDDEIWVTGGIYNTGISASLNHTEPIQWPVSMGGNGHSYEVVVVPEGITWIEANSLAEQNGGHLATITSQDENDFVFSLVNDRQYWNGSGGPLLGGYQLPGSSEPNGGWVWVTGEPFVYSNWQSGQPNNNGNENCIHFGWGGISPKWNDLEDTYTAYSIPIAYVVEYSHKTIYVDDNAAGTNDGSSWANAFWCLQDALAIARPGDKICVAQGVYKPDQQVVVSARSGTQIVASGNRKATFQLINDVVMKGGYAGFGHPDPNACDIEQYETILSGDLNGNDNNVNDPCDLLTESTRAENGYTVVTGFNVNCFLEGFTITDGNADGSIEDPSDSRMGGGMIIRFSSVTITNCTFRNNSARDGGGAISSISGSDPTLNNCIFTWNSCGSIVKEDSAIHLYGCGGGMYNNDSNLTLTNCTFSGNQARNFGGGMYNDTCTATITDCIFTANSAKRHGGGMDNMHSNLTLANCIFCGNSTDTGGGINNSNSNVGLINCTFTGNSAEIGNALACDSYNQESPSILELINCIIWDGDNEVWNNDDSIIFIEYSDVQGGWSGEGGDNIDADPLFVDADGADNVIGTEDDDLRILSGSPCIDAGDNSVIPESVVTDVDGNPRIVNNTVDIGACEFSLSSVPELYYVCQVATSKDDGYAFKATYQNLDTDFLKVGSSSFAKPPYYMSGMVFRNVDVPRGAEIVSACLKICAYNDQLTDIVFGKIEAEAADSSAAFGSSRHISYLPKTIASVHWDLTEPWLADTWYKSSDIADVIQEVIDRDGWSANNSLAIVYSTRSEGGCRNFSSYDRGSDYAPILEITYVP